MSLTQGALTPVAALPGSAHEPNRPQPRLWPAVVAVAAALGVVVVTASVLAFSSPLPGELETSNGRTVTAELTGGR